MDTFQNGEAILELMQTCDHIHKQGFQILLSSSAYFREHEDLLDNTLEPIDTDTPFDSELHLPLELSPFKMVHEPPSLDTLQNNEAILELMQTCDHIHTQDFQSLLSSSAYFGEHEDLLDNNIRTCCDHVTHRPVKMGTPLFLLKS